MSMDCITPILHISSPLPTMPASRPPNCIPIARFEDESRSPYGAGSSDPLLFTASFPPNRASHPPATKASPSASLANLSTLSHLHLPVNSSSQNGHSPPKSPASPFFLAQSADPFTAYAPVAITHLPRSRSGSNASTANGHAPSNGAFKGGPSSFSQHSLSQQHHSNGSGGTLSLIPDEDSTMYGVAL